MPLVSIRIVLQTLGFIIPTFWGLLYCSQTDRHFPVKILITVLISFAFVCAINFIEHAQHSFSRMYAGDVPAPFFQEHTIYSAMAGLMIPLAFILTAWFAQRNTLKFLLSTGILLLSISALILSYSRAALLSIIIAFFVYALIKLKIHWIIVCSMFLLGSLILFSQQEKILMSLRRNQIESKTKKTDVEKQLKSMVNVSNDVSNLERINRWKSAFRMIEEKPFLGFGYGTYQYKYFAYQKESEMTSISIRNPQSHYLAGTGGTTHSEYLLMSSENGILGGITYALLLACSIYFMLKNIKQIDSNSYEYYLILGIGMSITTYIVHSFFNNFLDASKIIFVFYAMLASMVSLDNNIQESISKKI